MACVLIVEDDPDFRDLMQVVFEAEGYRTLVAANGAAALEQMRKGGPAVVVLDIMMPVMDGWTFREQQLADKRLASVPVIAMTAGYDHAAVAKQLNIPCFLKPLDMEELLTAVKRLVG